MTIRECIFEAIANIADDLLQDMSDLLTCRELGAGFQAIAKENKLFLSGMEETDQYIFANPATFLAEKNLIGGAFNFDNVGNTFDPIDLLKNTVEIHRRRGSLMGLYADIKRLCNTVNVNIEHSNSTGTGWILDLSAPNFELNSNTYKDTSMNLILVEFQILIEYVVIETENQSIWSNSEVMKIISHEFIPIGLTSYIFIN
jgi:hypothetical protein